MEYPSHKTTADSQQNDSFQKETESFLQACKINEQRIILED